MNLKSTHPVMYRTWSSVMNRIQRGPIKHLHWKLWL